MVFESSELDPRKSLRHLFGYELRAARQAPERMSLDRVAELVNSSKSTIQRVEKAEQMIPPELPAALDRLFKTGGRFQRMYDHAKSEIHPNQFRRRMELEGRARRIQEFSGQIVPGLLQTEDYARAQFRISAPKASAEEIEDLVFARMSRQVIVSSPLTSDLSVILDEAVLHRAFGGPAVMRAQLALLADMTETPSTTLQVLPFSYGGHALVGGSLSLWTLDDGIQVAYEEAILTGTLLEDMAAVASRQVIYDHLRACAPSPSESADIIRSVMEALPT